jgi:hypothetical protein
MCIYLYEFFNWKWQWIGIKYLSSVINYCAYLDLFASFLVRQQLK